MAAAVINKAAENLPLVDQIAMDSPWALSNKAKLAEVVNKHKELFD